MGLSRFVGRLAGVIGVVTLVVVMGAQMSPSVADTVTVTATTTTSTTPSWDTFPRVTLDASSCLGSRCVAVGEQDLSEQVAVPFVERWAAGAWQQDPVPQPSRTTRRMSALDAVSCWSASGCVAVGSFFPSCCDEKAFAEVLAGSSWRLVRYAGSISPGSGPNALSCPSARFCVSVGDGSDRSWVEQWDGRRWARDTTPDPNTDPNTDRESGQSVNLTAVSCTDRRDCVAVGNWAPPSGQRYQLMPPDRPVAETYRDGTWVIQSPGARKASRYRLLSISCPKPDECMAVGSSGTVPARGHSVMKWKPLAELWNGQEWVAQRLPHPPGSSSLESVSCASPTSCTAVGNLESAPGSFVERWNGHVWAQRAIVIGPQPSDQQLIGFSCSTSGSCTASVWAWPQTTPILTLVGNKRTAQTQP